MVSIRTHVDADQDILALVVNTDLVNFTTEHHFRGHYPHLQTSVHAASCCMRVSSRLT